MAKITLKKQHLYYAAAALLPICAWMLLGFSAARVILGFAIAFIIPVYLILLRTSPDSDERIFFSIFLGLILPSMAVWFVDRLVGSLVWSTVIVSLALYGVAIYLLRRK